MAALTRPPTQDRPAPQEQTNPSATAGNLARYISDWHSITSNNFVLNIIREGYKINLDASNIDIPNVVTFASKLKSPLIAHEIDSLLQSGAISEVDQSDCLILSSVFVVPKSSGG